MFTLPYEIVAVICTVMLLCATLQAYLIHLRGITLKSPLVTFLLMGVFIIVALLFAGRAYALGASATATTLDVVCMVVLAAANVSLCQRIFSTRTRPGRRAS